MKKPRKLHSIDTHSPLQIIVIIIKTISFFATFGFVALLFKYLIEGNPLNTLYTILAILASFCVYSVLPTEDY